MLSHPFANSPHPLLDEFPTKHPYRYYIMYLQVNKLEVFWRIEKSKSLLHSLQL